MAVTDHQPSADRTLDELDDRTAPVADGSDGADPADRAHAPAPVVVRRYRMPRYGLWIGLGFLLGLALGLVLARTTNGPALVSAERSYLWLGIVFASLGALLAAVAAVVAEKIVNRGL